MMNYHKMQRVMKDYWADRNNYGCKWKITKPTVTTPGYVMIWKNDTLVRSVYSEGFTNKDIRMILENIVRLQKIR